MSEEEPTVILNGKKQMVFKPEMGEDEWLGYARSGFNNRSVYGVYFGIVKYSNKYEGDNLRAHLFLNLNDEGNIETFLANVVSDYKYKGYCPLTFYSDGCDDPCISAVDAYETSEIILNKFEREYASKRIKDVREQNNKLKDLKWKKWFDKMRA